MKINFPHGIMFHHFHDGKHHLKSQGFLNSNHLDKIIRIIGRKNILDADVFQQKFLENKLKNHETCLTFDDGIKGQYDIALPVLEKHKIKSFFFIYTSIFENNPDFLEVYRFFRHSYYKNIDQFYISFFKKIKIDLENFFKKKLSHIKKMKLLFPYYSINDIKFRIIRDDLIDSNIYKNIMLKMFSEKKFLPEKIFKKIYISRENLLEISNLGHSIGLHTHTHPTKIEVFSKKKQENEYKKNKLILSKITKKEIKSMSHPCGSYNNTTLTILKKLKITLGFKQFLHIEKKRSMKKINNSELEVPRRDSSDFIKYF